MFKLEELIELLGVKGTIAGLDASEYTNSELFELLSNYISRSSSKIKRIDMITSAVYAVRQQTMKRPDELITLSRDELESYFNSIKVTKEELQKILDELDVRPKNQSIKGMTKYVIDEIYDIGMYKRVAKGSNRTQ